MSQDGVVYENNFAKKGDQSIEFYGSCIYLYYCSNYGNDPVSLDFDAAEDLRDCLDFAIREGRKQKAEQIERMQREQRQEIVDNPDRNPYFILYDNSKDTVLTALCFWREKHGLPSYCMSGDASSCSEKTYGCSCKQLDYEYATPYEGQPDG